MTIRKSSFIFVTAIMQEWKELKFKMDFWRLHLSFVSQSLKLSLDSNFLMEHTWPNQCQLEYSSSTSAYQAKNYLPPRRQSDTAEVDHVLLNKAISVLLLLYYFDITCLRQTVISECYLPTIITHCEALISFVNLNKYIILNKMFIICSQQLIFL